jgi:hypothetical protein
MTVTHFCVTRVDGVYVDSSNPELESFGRLACLCRYYSCRDCDTSVTMRPIGGCLQEPKNVLTFLVSRALGWRKDEEEA